MTEPDRGGDTEPDRYQPAGFQYLRLAAWQKATLIGAGLLLLMISLTGPYLALAQLHQGHQQIGNLQRTEAEVKSLLQFVASVQSGPNAKASRDATAWYVEQMRAICAATPRCVPPQLPPTLQAELNQAAQAPTRPGSVRPEGERRTQAP